MFFGRHYDNLSNSDAILLTYGEFSYSSNFVGYVLGTSVDSHDEYFRNYILNSDFFNQPHEIVFRSLTGLLKKIGNKYYSPRGKSISKFFDKIIYWRYH